MVELLVGPHTLDRQLEVVREQGTQSLARTIATSQMRRSRLDASRPRPAGGLGRGRPVRRGGDLRPAPLQFERAGGQSDAPPGSCDLVGDRTPCRPAAQILKELVRADEFVLLPAGSQLAQPGAGLRHARRENHPSLDLVGPPGGQGSGHVQETRPGALLEVHRQPLGVGPQPRHRAGGDEQRRRLPGSGGLRLDPRRRLLHQDVRVDTPETESAHGRSTRRGAAIDHWPGPRGGLAQEEERRIVQMHLRIRRRRRASTALATPARPAAASR